MKALYIWLRLYAVCVCLFLGAGAAHAQHRPFQGLAVGVTGGLNTGGDHTIDLEVFGYSTSIADSELKGSSLGLSLDYLFALGNWRVGPRLRLTQGEWDGSDRIGNRYISFDTYIKLRKMHTLNAMVGYVVTPRLMPYVSAGLAVSHGTIGAKLNVLKYSVADSSSGWVGGPNVSLGVLYRLGKNSELGLEYSMARFHKRYEKCAKVLPDLCAGLPVTIAPRSINLTYNYRF